MPTIEIDGLKRFAIGSLCYPTPPEPGTVVGPHPITREWLTVIGTDKDGRTWLGPSTRDDLDALPAEPRSLSEILLARLRPAADGAR